MTCGCLCDRSPSWDPVSDGFIHKSTGMWIRNVIVLPWYEICQWEWLFLCLRFNWDFLKHLVSAWLNQNLPGYSGSPLLQPLFLPTFGFVDSLKFVYSPTLPLCSTFISPCLCSPVVIMLLATHHFNSTTQPRTVIYMEITLRTKRLSKNWNTFVVHWRLG